MADDNSARFRSNDSFGRGPAAPATDPLAELARLIGRNDPFSEYGRDSRPAAPPPQPAPDPGSSLSLPPAPQFHSEPGQPYAQEPYAQEPYAPGPYAQQSYTQAPYAQAPAVHEPAPAPRYSPEPTAPPYGQDTAPRYAADYPPRAYDDQAGHNDWPVPAPPPAPSHPLNDPFALPQHPPYVPQPASHHDNKGYAGPNFGNQPYMEPPARPARDSFQPDLPGFDPPAYAAAPDPQNHPPLYPHEPEAGGMPPPHDDEFYDDEPRGGRRKGLLTVVAVLGLAVIGTAGAFGYRSMFGGPGSSGPVPVIRANGEPSKVAPPPVTADQSASKFSYDRFGDAGKDEQVVRREEKPVDLSKTPPPPPRTVFPGAPVASPPSAKSAAGGAAMSAANPPSAIGEPRRVRTVPIRPDQGGDVAAAPPTQQPMSQQPMQVAPPRQVNAAPAGAAAAAPDDTPAARAAAARASSRLALRTTPPPATALAPAGNAPLSLSPDANNAPPPAAQEAFPPAPRASAPPPPARVASAPPPAAASAGGSYLVQVSSQRSEAEAESAYRGIQSKFGSVLGSQPHTVRRADLGAKGVYYRAMVGPFGSREEAIQVCTSLKQAGGECVVQH